MFIGSLRDDGIKTRTRGHYLGAIRQFTRWMRDERRAADDPLAGMKAETVTDEIEAGIFEPDELRRCFTITEQGKDRFSMTGFARRVLYQIAVETGFRSTECLMLTWGDIDLEGDTPTARVTAKRSKNRVEYLQPLTEGLRLILARWRDISESVDPLRPPIR